MSQTHHVTGQAVDFEVPTVSNFDLAQRISDNLQFDQVILENSTEGDPKSGWVHCSYIDDVNRKVALKYANGAFREGLFA